MARVKKTDAEILKSLELRAECQECKRHKSSGGKCEGRQNKIKKCNPCVICLRY